MKGFKIRKNTLIPWIITLGLGVYVYGLTYHAKNRPTPAPVYDFYDTALVKIQIRQSEDLHDVYGMYNNIIEGQKQIVKAQTAIGGNYRLMFRVNSPRPATLFVDDQAIEVFLVPGDTTLDIRMVVDPATYLLDSLSFAGKTAEICSYYRSKQTDFSDFHIRSKRNTANSEDFSVFCSELDSMAQRELDYIGEKDEEAGLPEWFVDFEESEILYQKAYLKLSNAYNRDIPVNMLDQIPVNSQEAVFSYYYYLYLKTYFASLDTSPVAVDLLNPNARYETLSRRHLVAADSLLEGEMHDVYLTRVIFSNLKRQNEPFARELLEAFTGKFNRMKYERFLKFQMRNAAPPL